MKIWLLATGAIVYDDQMGMSDSVGDLTTVVNGGSIVIHTR